MADSIWKNDRLLLINAQDSMKKAEQESLFNENSKDNAERSLVLVSEGTKHKQLVDQLNLVPANFEAILIGKDGTIKKRFEEPTKMLKVYEIIDQMPMRQIEMKQGHNK